MGKATGFKKNIFNIIKPIRSSLLAQRFFKNLHSLALVGLYGDDWNYKTNGELDVIRRLEHYAKGNKIVLFDVGANEGNYSTDVISCFPKGNLEIHAFEPVGSTFNLYQDKLKPYANQIIPNNFGLSNREGEETIFKFGKSTGFSSIYNTHSNHQDVTEEKIKLTTIDQYCAVKGIHKIDFLKVDVEGHDLFVFLGASSMLSKDAISLIQFEFGNDNLHSKTYFRDFYQLLNDRYRLFRVIKGKLLPVDDYRYELEVFSKVTNYLAVHRSIHF